MTRAFGLPVGVAKEVRELSFVWVVSVLVTGAAGLMGIGVLSSLGLVAYILGPVALGALSMGHEYSQRTLGMLLSQPVSRARLLLTKFGVLATMILALGLVAMVLVLLPRALGGIYVLRAPGGWETLVLPLVCGLLIAPWLTMLAKNPLAGMVFTLAVPALLWIVGGVVGHAGLQLAVLWWGTLALGAIAAVSSWRMFMRLEVIEGRSSDLTWPGWLGGRAGVVQSVRTSAGAPHPFRRLVQKELHIQQMTFVAAGLYVVAWFGVDLTENSLRQFASVASLRLVLSMFYAGLVALLTGALASAEERQFGTLEWQILLPVAAWKQWAVKAGVAVGLSLVLSLGIPALLAYVSPPTDGLDELRRFFAPPAAGIVVILSVTGLYFSSRSSSGIRAFLTALSVALGLSLLAPGALIVFSRQLADWFLNASIKIAQGLRTVEPALLRPVMNAAPFVGLALAVVLLLRFGFTNHRSADRGRGAARSQAIWIIVLMVLTVVLTVGTTAFYRAALLSRLHFVAPSQLPAPRGPAR